MYRPEESQLDDQLQFDRCIPITGVNNSLPPAEIQPTEVADACDRLSERDGLNRPRPGIVKRVKAPDAVSSWDWSIHMKDGVFLCVSGGQYWYEWDSRAKVLTAKTGGPVYAAGAFISGAMATDTVYFSNGTGMAKYKPGTGAGTGFGTVTLPTQYPNAAYIVWGCGPRLYYVPPKSNVVVCSDILSPEVFDPILNLVQLDPVTSDWITGIAIWQEQQLIVGRNGSTSAVGSGIQTPISQWTINTVSRVIGPINHQTIAQVGLDIYFLSETGRGVYACSQIPTSEQIGIHTPVSLSIQRYINRINWTAATAQARSICWNDLFMLAVPIDGSLNNNVILIYSIALGTWQGIWEPDSPPRTFSRDPTPVDSTYLLVGRLDGVLANWTYPQDRQYYDLELDGTTVTRYHSDLTTRSFLYSEEFNAVWPYNAQFTFLESEDPVTVTAVIDRQESSIRMIETTSLGTVNLVIPALPFNLGGTGYKVAAVALQKIGLCRELQYKMEGTGNWTLAKILTSAFIVRAPANV
jgi:hypothetical protein